MEEENNEVIRKKELTFRGKSIEELKKMEIREFATLLKSNEKRTLLRQYDMIQRFVISCQEKIHNNKQIRTHLRDIVIVPKLVGMRIAIHTGKEYTPIDINLEMLGHRLGEFATTRSKVKHGAAGIGATRSSASKSVK
jgi:small subunit ribosomal protein S19